MKKKAFWIVLGLCLLCGRAAQAQTAFWAYDDDDNESQIPSECDGTFDENRGGVFIPTPEEMAERGEEFLISGDPVERNKAGFCLIGAALQGHVPSQYRVAQLYNKGIVLPQDDLSAYRWAFLASLNGSEDASKLALLLERFLTTEEIERATQSIQQLLPEIGSRNKEFLAEWEGRVRAKQKELDLLNAEIDRELGLKTLSPGVSRPAARPKAPDVAPTNNIFSEKDRL